MKSAGELTPNFFNAPSKNFLYSAEPSNTDLDASSKSDDKPNPNPSFAEIPFLPILAKHRGWTHYRTTAVLLPLPLLLVPIYAFQGSLVDGVPYYLAAVTGYFSHLFFDKKLI